MDFDAIATPRFEAEVVRYNKWREDLAKSVQSYHDWLEKTKQLDVNQSIRFYDLLENLNRGRLLLAFLAEFSRGKSELINALFFSSFKERLLPSNVGRTTMCPTEIFHDPNEEPYLKLLSVETRYRDESISQLKNMPVEWSRIRLNIDSPAQMREALKALADTKRVYSLDARMMGLIPMFDESGNAPAEDEIVEVPAWRYAMINYPHPLLTNGLAVLDTPGLNALGLEPELTLQTVPNAHAILFLLSIDTGVTKSDLEIWERYVKQGLPAKIAVLNKVDLLWDELKTPQEIEAAQARMIESTAETLGLDKSKVFAVSAQKALLGRIRDEHETVRKSGIESLERYLADEVIPIRRQLLARAVTSELGTMMAASKVTLSQKLSANQHAIAELASVQGKSRDLVMKLWAAISEEKEAYNNALAEYKVNKLQFNQRRIALLDMLNPMKMDALCAKSRQGMDESWTTLTLIGGMRELIRMMNEEFDRVSTAGEDVKKMMAAVYNTFHVKFKFKQMEFPPLDFEGPRARLQRLIEETDKFCSDPVNIVGLEKRFMIGRFYARLVEGARLAFGQARSETERWLIQVPQPLENQIQAHKDQIQSRLDSLQKVNDRKGTIDAEMAKLNAQRAELMTQFGMINGLMAKVKDIGPPPA